jgi:hypothetical protein
MKRRNFLFLSATAAMIAVATLAAQRQQPPLLVLEWAAKAAAETPPRAILIEMGLKDVKARDWSGHAIINGAKVVHREGYRFRKEDKLTDPDGWAAGSHRGMRVPPKQPQVSKMEPIATVGVVLHLTEVTPDAKLTVELADKATAKLVIPLKEVLAGVTVPLWNGEAEVRLVSTATPVVTGPTEDDFPAAAYGPDGTLWLAYNSYTLRDENRRIEAPQFKEQPENFKALYKPEFADQLFVKYYRGGKWSEPMPVTGPKQDIVRCGIAAESNGDVWVVYSANRNGKYEVLARCFSAKYRKQGDPGVDPIAGETIKLLEGSAGYLSPAACTDQNGAVQIVCQSLREERPILQTAGLTVQKGKAQGPYSLPASANHWYHAIAASPSGDYAVAHDEYRDDYDISVTVRSAKGVERVARMSASSSRSEARPSLAYDGQGRLWIAYEEGPEQWGKDYGALAPNKGNPLYNERSVRVVCLDKDTLYKPVAELPTSRYAAPVLPFEPAKTNRYENTSRFAYPRIGLDGKGRIWLTYRQNFGSRYSSHPGSYWLTFARRLDGDHWSGPIEIHHSDGLLDSRPVLLPHKSGGLLVIHNTDGRYTAPETINNEIYLSYVDLPGERVEPKLVPHEPGNKDEKLVQMAKKEQEDVKRIRTYRVDAGGKKLQLLRGEFHRHTEISWDGGADGSLEDMFRYAIDAAAMDWIGNGDHDNGAGREYSWWLTQKFDDAYHVKDRFTPMFTYERSVSYPHGHRNCMFAQRGVMTLPRLAPPPGGKAPGGVHPDDAKMLYRYLHELDGICASHTSATGMGTDWRDNDPKVEPVVEIYQGDRMSYEMEGAPRSGFDPQTGMFPANVAGWYPKGFINHAFEKGYRLGFQASSDHWSTHISFFIVLAERNDRQAILDAVKKRHCYGATDNIIVDLRSGDHIMGDDFTANGAPSLQFTVHGTNDLAKIVILKDSKVVETIRPRGRDHRGTWTDPAAGTGTHYYYIRVEQTDGELAWASPLWIRQGS